ncbi:permease YjgP/YjgQ family protein [Chthoniobacter flavus Ellin428]|uniref:Permease YjgP/YjgQ family protein n=1 Tax=Chthoniobacter flavus Ellin428 TaxID=497964 RepID=B4CW87_9BACT|nr:LptF/LptG family permease [Chthoniobacter flavus]EDY21679.1 permease YjgP/YjgQ family protein [Chthoniobacter flavus Ellin428]TCO95617.1 lipopolysaccharide export system permease protein [Chthoniobacter flavus]
MKLIDRYVGGQLLVTFSLAVSVLSVVLVLGNIFKQLLDLLVKNDTPLEVVVSFLSYILPFSLSFTIPWAFLTAVLLVFGRLSAEHELVAFRASGVSIPRLCYTVFLLAAACVATCFWINIDVAPRAQGKMKEALYNVAVTNPLAMFGADLVIDSFPNKKIYLESSNGPELHNLLVYESNDDNLLLKVIFARRGLIETDGEKKQLLLHIYDATYEARDDDDVENLLKIKQGITMREATLPISLEELHKKYHKGGLPSMTTGALLDHLSEKTESTMTEKERIEQHSATITEINKRYSFSLAAICFALVGVPLAITAHRKETSIGFLISLCVALVYYFFIIIANTVREKPQWHPAELVWVPNILCVVFGGWLFYRMSRR